MSKKTTDCVYLGFDYGNDDGFEYETGSLKEVDFFPVVIKINYPIRHFPLRKGRTKADMEVTIK